MAKIRKDEQRETPEMSTSSLPDIIFMFLFFFMMITTMKEVTYQVQVMLPQATEVQKLENKSLIRYIYIGKPMSDKQKEYGTVSRVQIGDSFVNSMKDLGDHIVRERSAMKEEDQNLMTVSIKSDKETRMGIVTDVKQELRRVYALRINYAATQKANTQ